jgi:uncharacterized protein (DUF427 family)
VHKEKPGPGQESVWDYPRPPRLEPSTKTIRILHNGQLIAQSHAPYRVLETSHPPTWYIPAADIHREFLAPSNQTSLCEWKGRASYWTIRAGGQISENAAWSYESPNPSFAPIKGCLAFYPSRFECYVDDELVLAQPGDFYGGWITHDIGGPFKGIPGSLSW